MTFRVTCLLVTRLRSQVSLGGESLNSENFLRYYRRSIYFTLCYFRSVKVREVTSDVTFPSRTEVKLRFWFLFKETSQRERTGQVKKKIHSPKKKIRVIKIRWKIRPWRFLPGHQPALPLLCVVTFTPTLFRFFRLFNWEILYRFAMGFPILLST